MNLYKHIFKSSMALHMLRVGILLLLLSCTSSASRTETSSSEAQKETSHNSTIPEISKDIDTKTGKAEIQENPVLNNDIIFDTSKKIVLSLGDEDSQNARVLYTYYGEDQKPVLVRTNNKSYSQTIYDYETKSLIDTHYWRGDSISGNLVVSNGIDTIFSFTDGSRSHFSSKIGGNYYKKRLPITVKPGRIEQRPSNIKPFSLINGKWYFTCSRLGEYPEEMKSGKDRLPLFELDTDMIHCRYFGEYPELYAHNNMGTVSAHWAPYMCSPSDNRRVIVGFTATPDMYVYDPSTDQAKWVTAKSRYVDSIPLPLTAKGRDYFSDSESYYEFAQYSHYGQIIYDRWRDVYYRFVGLGLNNRKLKYHPFIEDDKAFVIMVLDKSLNVIDEQFIGDKYIMYIYFITPEGLFIQNKGSNKKRITYNCFKLINSK